jgi:hypothetical protein
MTEAELLITGIGAGAVAVLVVGVVSNCAHWHELKRRSGWK